VPFEAETIEEVVAGHVHTPLTQPIHVRPDISQPTNEALMTAMAKEPSNRYPNYDAFIMALTAARSQLLVRMLRHHEPIEAPETQGEVPPQNKGWWRR
jgi:hypothetical protein